MPPTPPAASVASTPQRSHLLGLRADEVRERVLDGRTNAVPVETSRPLVEIVRANVLTRFNAILGTLFELGWRLARRQRG